MGIKVTDPKAKNCRLENIAIEKRSIIISLHNTWQGIEEAQNA